MSYYYNKTKKESFLNLPAWLEDTLESAHENTKVVIVGNKADLAYRAVELSKATVYLHFFELNLYSCEHLMFF
jgi:GTPase SAR1 family protein